MTCANRSCLNGHYASTAAWYCSGSCKLDHEAAERDRLAWAQPPVPAANMAAGLRAALGLPVTA